jgi:glycosyltransferase involved in cell wall biosynthesis
MTPRPRSRAPDAPPAAVKPSRGTKPPKREGSFFVSSRIHTGADGSAADSFVPGEAHYSYVLARNKFLEMFRALNYDFQLLDRPEIYFSDLSRRDLKFPLNRAPHLIFKPFEHMRFLKGARNIACVAWEFDRLLTADTAKDRLLPMQDYVAVASRLDEIWTPSRFTRDTFARHGIERCYIIPAPIAEQPPHLERKADVPRVLLTNFVFGGGWYQPRVLRSSSYLTLPEVFAQHFGGVRPKVFVTIFNPADWRKNAGALLRAFLAFHQHHPDTMLIVKFVSDPSLGHLEHLLDHHIRIRMHEMHFTFSFAIWVTDEFLPEATYGKLLGCADFYLCTSFCEGQNLPLLEAMSRGVVPVSVNHTAMADYLDDLNAIVIPSSISDFDIHESSAGRIQGAHWFEAAETDVMRALDAAANLPDASYQALSAAARKTVRDRFAQPAVARLVQARLAELARS